MGKVLIATYSWSGNTKRVAQQLLKLSPEADSYEIKVADGTFDSDMYRTDDIATNQINSNNYPALVNVLPNMSQYDLILVGSPVWHGRPATPIHTFLNEIQGFNGKIATFYTDAGTANGYEQTFKDWAGNLTILPGHEGKSGLEIWIKQLI